MKIESYNIALNHLREYIASGNRRNTPEREEVLRAAYSFDARFTFDEIQDYISNHSQLLISGTTIYNSLKLFVELGFMRCVRQNSRSYYDISLTANSCKQICRICGKTTLLDSKKAAKLIAGIKLKRFTSETFTLTFDGICSTCKTKQTKAAKKKATKKDRNN
ncbi:MAG: transcriptional repressor [Bacteroidaceae bacterium]|nr:transcriptional repressor [Bacteroidaceae bacterium]